MDYKENAKIFKAFCDENRLRILDMLKTGTKCACVLLKSLDISQSTLSHHMKILVESGIVEIEKEGKWNYYSISEKGSLIAKQLLEDITTVNEQNLDYKCT